MTPQTVLRMFDDWLQNSTYGVNKKLDYLEAQSLLDGDSVPPDIAFVGNSYDDACVAKGDKPPSRPALYVTHELPARFSGRDQAPGRVEGVVPVAIRYITVHGDLIQGRKDAGHTMRAIRMCLADLFSNAQSAARTRAGLHIEHYEELLVGEIQETIGGAQVTGGMLIRCNVIDSHP